MLDNYRALYNGHLSRWLTALEIGADEVMVRHGNAMSNMLSKIGQLTRELLPPGAHTSIQQNLYMSPDFYQFQRRALKVLRAHPEVMGDWLREFRSEASSVLIAAPPAIEEVSSAVAAE